MQCILTENVGFSVGDRVGFNVGDRVGFNVGSGEVGTISVGEVGFKVGYPSAFHPSPGVHIIN